MGSEEVNKFYLNFSLIKSKSAFYILVFFPDLQDFFFAVMADFFGFFELLKKLFLWICSAVITTDR